MTIISIHALRVEGDIKLQILYFLHRNISIHALRVEGDRSDYVIRVLIL